MQKTQEDTLELKNETQLTYYDPRLGSKLLRTIKVEIKDLFILIEILLRDIFGN